MKRATTKNLSLETLGSQVDVKVNGSHSAPFYIGGLVDPNQGSMIFRSELLANAKRKTVIRIDKNMF
jgi:hypothetical protein